MVATVIVGVKLRLWWWPTRPGYEYQRVFSATAAGLLFFIARPSGWDLSHSHGLFQGTRWVEHPVWWQVIVGLGFLLLAGFWARRRISNG
jgi:hypothetical protein